MSSASIPAATESESWSQVAQALRRAALAVAQSGGLEHFDPLLEELTTRLGVAVAFVAVFDDRERTRMRSLAARLDGRKLRPFDYLLARSPCSKVVGPDFCYVERGAFDGFPRDTIFAAKRMDSYAAYPLTDSSGVQRGLLVAMDRAPIADPVLAEAMLKIFAVRIAGEIERRAADDELRRSEEQYRVIFEAASDAFVLRNSALRVVDVNPAFERLYGFSPAQLQTDTGYPSGFPTGYIEARQALLRRALAGEPIRVETVALRADGSTFEADLRVMPLRYRGEPHVLQVVRDITERKQAERALATREAQYRAIFDGASDAMVLWSREIRVVDVNRAFTEISGLPRSEAIGSTLSDRLPPDEVERRLEFVRRALAGEACQMETNGFGRDGQRFDLEVRYLPIIHRGEPHVLSVGRDVSARRRAEAEHAEFEARLRHAQKMEAIGQLTGGIAHDFNNILTAVMGYLEMAAERAQAHRDAKLSHQLDQAQLAATHARDLIAQMMTFARPQRVSRTALRLSPVVRQAVQLLRATMPASIRLDVGVDDRVAAVEADAVQLEQVLFNLCINARDAIGAGTGSIRIQLRAEHAGEGHCASCRAPIHGGPGWVELSVTDSGSGILPEVLDRMFDPFFTTKEVGRGSGMGLAMVHGIVHEHGGHLRVDSVRGRGSTFRVLLPSVTGPLDAATTAVGAPRAAKAERLRGRVLVVEDQSMVGGFMEELLASWGLETVLRDDPRDALLLLEDGTEAIDLLLTDLTMPHLTGIELAARAAALRPRLPVLVYTGDPGEPEPETLLRGGIGALIRKPIDPAALRAELRRLLSADREPAPKVLEK